MKCDVYVWKLKQSNGIAMCEIQVSRHVCSVRRLMFNPSHLDISSTHAQRYEQRERISSVAEVAFR